MAQLTRKEDGRLWWPRRWLPCSRRERPQRREEGLAGRAQRQGSQRKPGGSWFSNGAGSRQDCRGPGSSNTPGRGSGWNS